MPFHGILRNLSCRSDYPVFEILMTFCSRYYVDYRLNPSRLSHSSGGRDERIADGHIIRPACRPACEHLADLIDVKTGCKITV